jgi:hypothetical protein
LQLHYLDLAIGSLTTLAALIYFREEAVSGLLHSFAWLAVRFGGL